MSLIIDGIIIIICVLIIIKALRAGLVKSAMGLLKGIASLFSAYAFTPILGKIIYEKFALKGLSAGIEETIRSLSKIGDGSSFNLAKMIEDMPDAFRQIIDRYGASADSLKEHFSGVTEGNVDSVKSLADYISSPVAETLSNAASFIIIFVGVFIVLTIVTSILDAIFHLPVLNGANKIFGLLFGIAEALLFAFVISLLLSAVMKALGSVDSTLFGEHVIENSIVLKFFSKYNLLQIIGNVIN